MTDDRETVLARIREALAGVESRAPRPEFDDALPTARDSAPDRPLLEVFLARFQAAAGRVVEGPDGLVALLAGSEVTSAYVDPRLPTGLARGLAAANIEVVKEFDRRRAEEIGAAVTPATGAIAETGSLILSDADTHDRLAAVAPWVHVAVLDPATIEPSLVTALAHLPEDPNIVLVTGPSQTADVEGILIRGVHGPGIQACLPMAWRNLGETS